jgi:hypothetical protein
LEAFLGDFFDPLEIESFRFKDGRGWVNQPFYGVGGIGIASDSLKELPGD